MSQNPEIRPLTGFCSLNFGQTKEEAIALFGPPSEEQTLTDAVFDTSSLVFHYWDLGFSLFFDNLKSQIFASVEIDNPETLLFGIKLFELNENEVTELLKSKGFPLSESEKESWGEKRLSFDDAGLDCYFQNNKLLSVNFGTIETDETDNGFYYFPN